MTGVNRAYLSKTAVYFEPSSEREAVDVQLRLLDFGYCWADASGRRDVAYLRLCLLKGVTALPEGRMMVGKPLEGVVVRRECADLLCQSVAAVKRTAPAVPGMTLSASTQPVGRKNELAMLRSELELLRQDMKRRFDASARRQDAIERRQQELTHRLDEVMALLRPRPLDLGVKKPGGGKAS